MDYKLNITSGFVVSFEVNGILKEILEPVPTSTIEGLISTQGTIYLKDGTLYSFRVAGGSALSTSPSSLLEYIFTRDNLFQGTEQDEPVGAKGYTTSTSETPLLDFYKIFAYNETNYKLIVGSPNVEVSFLCSDRRSGVAGSRRNWSPYFKLSDLMKDTFTLIQDDLIGTDTTSGYNIQGKITKNANGVLFITITDTHSGNNLYGSIINIRHRVV